jgi:hypothetical protein
VRETLDRDGYSLFRIGLSLSDIPGHRRGRAVVSPNGWVVG